MRLNSRINFWQPNVTRIVRTRNLGDVSQGEQCRAPNQQQEPGTTVTAEGQGDKPPKQPPQLEQELS